MEWNKTGPQATVTITTSLTGPGSKLASNAVHAAEV